MKRNLLFTGAMALSASAWLVACGTANEPSAPKPAASAQFVTEHAALGASTFEIDNPPSGANLKVQAGTDWHSPAPNIAGGVDDPVKATDNAFGKGAKDDTVDPAVVDDSIPPNKSDLERFYIGNEVVGGHDFLYLAWERTNVLGSANMSFEFNQGATPLSSPPGRSPGDMLIVFDWASGANEVNLQVSRWVTSGDPKVVCESNPSVPCWGTLQDLTPPPPAIPFAVASVNETADVCDRLVCAAGPSVCTPTLGAGNDDPPCGAGRLLPAKTFGEAAIDLTAAGITGCFPSAFLKSRSSDAFNAELKDFIAPIPTNLCKPAHITLRKVDNQTPPVPLAGAVLQLWFDANGSGTINAGDVQVKPDGVTAACTGSPNPCNCTTTDTNTLVCDGTNVAGVGNCEFTVLTAGDYIAREVSPPPGYDCAGPCPVDLPPITVAITAVEQCIKPFLQFVDAPTPGDITVLKLDDTTPGAPLAGAVFKLWNDVDKNGLLNKSIDTVFTPPTTGLTCTTGDGTGGTTLGQCSFTSLNPGFYCVEETAAPAGHFLPTTTSQCGEIETTAGGDTLSFTFRDPRQFRVIVVVCEEPGDTLYPSNVKMTVGGVEVTKVSAASDTAAATLCTRTVDVNTDGAHFTPLPSGIHQCEINIGTTPVP